MKSIELIHPITKGERTICELTLQDPKVRHMIRTDGHEITTIGADIALLSALSGEPEILLQEISLEDWAKIRVVLARVYAAFYGLDPDKVSKKSGKQSEPEKREPVQNPPRAAEV
ncbi:phage tail assembly protein [Breznakiella homolactica]|uniref:Phage tail assembly protein n=1 Tax=Breznakiella homolactica TaxID=2798577 RepID=A0A7T7XPX0_9SPIR|nr:phage tail assembly protein [Breznakiella homolactica]QQO10320.1 phage tail assembly protein [Breznakiella homolactica]